MKSLGPAPSVDTELPNVGQTRALTPTITTFSFTGTLSVRTGANRWYNDSTRTYTMTTVRASVGTAPTGATIIVDVRKNGSTVFTTTANRPTIAISGFTATNGGAPDIPSVAPGDYLTIDVIQVGSTIPGSDLSVQIVLT